MGKIFPIIVIIVAIIGFSSSAYLFSESKISIEPQNNKSVMDEIEACIEQNLAGDTIALNSFNANMLLALKESVNEAQTDQELEEIRMRLQTLTNCK
tara:strand:- start:367 stop:657 length:291 start_codon:yes stop_codon:yes gene_type:complete